MSDPTVQTKNDERRICTILDWENAHVQKDMKAEAITSGIRSALARMSMTGPIDLYGYGNIKALSTNSFSKLQATGMKMLHVPPGEKPKNATDRSILTEMFIWALKNPIPSIVLLITGDGDFANPIHELRSLGYKILVAHITHPNRELLFGADVVWKWPDLVVGDPPYFIKGEIVYDLVPHVVKAWEERKMEIKRKDIIVYRPPLMKDHYREREERESKKKEENEIFATKFISAIENLKKMKKVTSYTNIHRALSFGNFQNNEFAEKTLDWAIKSDMVTTIGPGTEWI